MAVPTSPTDKEIAKELTLAILQKMNAPVTEGKRTQDFNQLAVDITSIYNTILSGMNKS